MSQNKRGSIGVICVFCGHTFGVPHSMKGGLANCPSCEKATKVRSGLESLFWLICVGGLLAILFLAGLATWAEGWGVGLTILVLGLVIWGGALASS